MVLRLIFKFSEFVSLGRMLIYNKKKRVQVLILAVHHIECYPNQRYCFELIYD